ncbi:MAG: ABC transporter ATP-binding protein [Patescibacteria group bacterium]
MQNGGETDKSPVLKFTLKEKLSAYWRFLKILWSANKKLTIFRFILLVFSTFLQPVEIYAFSLFIAAIATGQTDRAPLLLSIVLGCYLLRSLVNELTYSKLNDWFEKVCWFSTQEYIYSHISKLGPGALNQPDVRRSLDFVREDLWRLNRMTDQTEWFLRSIFKFIGTLGLALTAPWWVCMLAVTDALFSSFNLWHESAKDIWVATWNSLDGRRIEYTKLLFLNTKFFRDIKLLGAEAMVMKKFRQAGANVLLRFKKISLTSARNRTLLALVHGLTYGIVLLILGKQAFEGPAMLAVLYVSINLFGMMGDALSGISGSLSTIRTDMEIMAYINRLLKTPVEPTSGLRLPKNKMEIRFEHVCFRYPNAKQNALDDLSITFKEGEHLAIVGENGAGKTTFMRLLSGLEQPTSGQILINDKPLKDYHPLEWRDAFHSMLQDSDLYQDFVEDNLNYGKPATKSRSGFNLLSAVKIAGSDTVIDSLPQGYKTFLGDWAAPPGIVPHQVSGGQAQRLIISRSLIHGGRILAFDEPTSAMDANAEMGFFERLLEASGKRGLIFISHRFSTVRRADRIIVFHNGILQEQGSHQELVKKGGKYAELYNQQAQWYS